MIKPLRWSATKKQGDRYYRASTTAFGTFLIERYINRGLLSDSWSVRFIPWSPGPIETLTYGVSSVEAAEKVAQKDWAKKIRRHLVPVKRLPQTEIDRRDARRHTAIM